MVVGRLAIRFQFDIPLLVLRRNRHAYSGVFDDVPTDAVVVSAVERIRERTLNRVRSNRIEEARRSIRNLTVLKLRHNRVLIRRSKLREGTTLRGYGMRLYRGQRNSVLLAHRSGGWRRRAASTSCSRSRRVESPAKSPVDVTGRLRFACSRAGLIGRNEAGADCVQS